jgi:Uma2 family endonuclease
MESDEERYYSVEEYLALEEKASGKNEYFDGRIYAMTGASLNHAQMTMNVQVLLANRLRGRPCRAFNSDVSVLVSETGLYTYPDASALCGEPRFQEANSAILLNPSVIVEVLSPSTESYDRGEKYTHYKRMPSLREYVLIAQDRVRVERRTRGDDSAAEWGLLSLEDLDAALDLASIGCTLALRDVYEHVELPPRPPLRAVYEQPAGYAANF